MSSLFLQYVFSGLTIGAIYALIGLGFSLIYNARHMINFAQGEFVMIGAMTTITLVGTGVPLILAIVIAIVVTCAVGAMVERFAVEPARNASIVTLIIITIGASIALRGGAQLIWGRQFHSLPAFSGTKPLTLLGASIVPQTLWILGAAFLIVVGLRWFFGRTLLGKAMQATSFNPLAAQLAGINIHRIYLLNFMLAAGMGALAGILAAPITLTSFDAGIMLGLKGFSAAIVGGLGSPAGAVAGGLILGLVEALAAGYISSAYKDAVAFILILLMLFIMPSGIFKHSTGERV